MHTKTHGLYTLSAICAWDCIDDLNPVPGFAHAGSVSVIGECWGFSVATSSEPEGRELRSPPPAGVEPSALIALFAPPSQRIPRQGCMGRPHSRVAGAQSPKQVRGKVADNTRAMVTMYQR